MEITLNETGKRLLAELMTEGDYKSPSAVVLEALRRLHHEHSMRRELEPLLSVERRPGDPASNAADLIAYFDRIESEAAAQRRRRKS